MSERVLQHVSNQLGLRAYLAEIRARREFVVHAPLNDLRTANMDTVLGNLWFLVNPALSIGIYYVVFGLLLKIDRGIDNYVGYLVVGITVFNMIVQTTVKASRSMVANESLIRSLYFPRAIIPLSSTLEGIYTFVPSILVMLIAVVATGERPALRNLLVVPALILAMAFMAGLVFVMARAGRRYRDIASLLPHLARLMFYASGVLYDPRTRTENEFVLGLFEWNPFYLAMLLTRNALLGTPVEAWSWAVMTGWSTLALCGGFIFFWNGESRYGA